MCDVADEPRGKKQKAAQPDKPAAQVQFMCCSLRLCICAETAANTARTGTFATTSHVQTNIYSFCHMTMTCIWQNDNM